MRLKGLLLFAFLLAAGGSPSSAQQLPQLPQLPPLPPLPSVPDTTKPVEETTKKVVEDVNKAVDQTGDAVGSTPTPSPGAGSGDGSGSEGGGGTVPKPAAGGANQPSDGGGSAGSAGFSHECPGEGRLGGGGGRGPTILSSAVVGGLPSGEGVLGIEAGEESGGPAAALEDAAARTGPLVLAVFAFGALLLLVGLAGGLRALQGRLKGI
jgi:hypothetical protein